MSDLFFVSTLDALSWPMIFLGGLLGSAHCVGMCGGFAVMVGSNSHSVLANLQRQLSYSCGRLAAYGLAGGLLAAVGHRMSRALPFVNWLQAALSLIAGGLLLSEGLKAVGWWPGRSARQRGVCPIRDGFAALLRSGRVMPLFVAGMLTGWLPCGLVYAFWALAANSGSVGRGVLTMLVFGSGTVPLMVTTGLVSGWVGLSMRRNLMRVAAWCLMGLGLMTIVRGAAFASGNLDENVPRCPLCPPIHSAESH